MNSGVAPAGCTQFQQNIVIPSKARDLLFAIRQGAASAVPKIATPLGLQPLRSQLRSEDI